MDKDKRELTEKEWKRKDCFETLSSEMQQKGYKLKNVMINTQKAKYLALLVMFPFMALAFWLYNNVNGFNLDGLSWGYAVALPLLILGLIEEACIAPILTNVVLQFLRNENQENICQGGFHPKDEIPPISQNLRRLF